MATANKKCKENKIAVGNWTVVVTYFINSALLCHLLGSPIYPRIRPITFWENIYVHEK